jgi:hypothetical protein
MIKRILNRIHDWLLYEPMDELDTDVYPLYDPTLNIFNQNYTVAGMINLGGAPNITPTLNMGNVYTGLITGPITNTVITYVGKNNQEIVRLTTDGEVIWQNGIDIDAAAEALSKSLVLSSEMMIGITKSVKRKMRHTAIEELIESAKEKGFLTVEELTFMLESSKILDKLKGIDK